MDKSAGDNKTKESTEVGSRTTTSPNLAVYVTTLLSGLISLALLSTIGLSLLDYWLGDSSSNFFSNYLYNFYLYLAIAMILFAALHIWTHVRSYQITTSEAHRQAAQVFLAIFATILTVVVVCNLVSVSFVAKNVLLGTGDYSTKSLWLAILAPLQAGLWAGLLCWYFKKGRQPRAMRLYVIAVAGLSAIAALSLFMFPVLAKRATIIDERTASDLSSISASINRYTTEHNSLPNNLSSVTLDEKVKSRLGQYEYSKVATSNAAKSPADGVSIDIERLTQTYSSYSYKLCATFLTKTTTEKPTDRIFTALIGGPTNQDFSEHGVGRQCFTKSTYAAYDLGNSGAVTADQPKSTATEPARD